jgi:ribosomal protein S27E
MADRATKGDSFSPEEADQIRELMRTPRARVACPRCGETLVLSGPIAGVGTTRRYYEVACRHCALNAIVTEAPGSRAQ